MSIDLKHLLVHSLEMPLDSSAGKVVLITGAGRGIGLAAAKAFALLGGKVVIAELSEDGRQVENDIRQAGGSAFYVRTDVSDPQSMASLSERVKNEYGAVDILVNNAIRIQSKPVLEMELAEWDQIIAVNLRGTFLACKTFLPEMLARGNGVIINMISTEAMPGLSAYIASKQGIAGFTQSLALEVGPQGVHAIPFGPGMVDTPGIRSVSGDLAPRLGMTPEQFLNISLHAAYAGLMPAEHAGAAIALLALRYSAEFHGQPVTGYEILERAGFLGKTNLNEIVETDPEVSGKDDGLESREEILQLVSEVKEILNDTAGEFEKLPAFVRPIARSGFKGKSGMSLADWQRKLSLLESYLERFQNSPKDNGNLAEMVNEINPRLEKLVTYYQGVPAETARFTRDRAMLDQVLQICRARIDTINKLSKTLKPLGKI